HSTRDNRLERHSLRTSQSSGVLQLRRYRNLCQPGLQIHQHPIKELAAQQRRRSYPPNLLRVLHLAQRCHQRTHRNKHPPPHLPRNDLPHRLQSRHGCMRRVEPAPPHSGSLHPLAGGCQHRLGRNHHPAPHSLDLCLGRVPPI